MATIKTAKARQIFDSRGNPTVEVDITLCDGTITKAAVPSGASTGIYEALELRDRGSNYLRKYVSKGMEVLERARKKRRRSEQEEEEGDAQAAGDKRDIVGFN